MAESNFIDYVKILCLGQERVAQEAVISIGRSTCQKADPMAATADVAVYHT